MPTCGRTVRRITTVKRLVTGIGWSTVVFLVLVGMTSVVMRALNWSDFSRDVLVFDPSFSDPTPGSLEGRYQAHPLLTLIHILPGFLVLALGPLQFLPQVRRHHINVHRWSGRLFVVAALVTAVAAMLVTFVFPVFGGFSAQVAMVFFGVIFLVTVVKAFVHIRRRQIPEHREWMVRAFAIALGISTFRVLGSVFMIAGVSFRDTWDTVIWLSFALNMVVAEVWINVSRAAHRAPTATQAT